MTRMPSPRGNLNPKFSNVDRIAITWSGGVDSTALIAEMLRRSYHVTAVTLNIYQDRQPHMFRREREARKLLTPDLIKLANKFAGSFSQVEHPCEWIWALATPGSEEIPHRNKRIMDWMIVNILQPMGTYNLGMGEYIGVDTWLVKDHVAGLDADARYLSSYLLHEYGIDYRLITLADCGESRYKWQRLLLGYIAFGGGGYGMRVMGLTTNCLANTESQCGRCYKCVERRAAFMHWQGEDHTQYATEPKQSLVNKYIDQMRGHDVTTSHLSFRS